MKLYLISTSELTRDGESFTHIPHLVAAPDEPSAKTCLTAGGWSAVVSVREVKLPDLTKMKKPRIVY